MIFSRCSKIQRKEVMFGDGDDDDANNHDLELISDFLKEANEGILFEIFLHLPNCRSAILFGSVCRPWHSLISQPQFIPRFISHHHEHQDRYSVPYTIIFRKVEKNPFYDPQYGPDGAKRFQPIYNLFSEESMFLHGNKAATSSTSYLDFLPSSMVVRASCNDLLLVSQDKHHSTDRYICNPITKKFSKLPDIHDYSRPTITGHALVCCNKQLNHFKVVYLNHPFPDHEIKHHMMIFSTKSGKWRRRRFHYPRPKRLVFNPSLDVVTCNGTIYWMEYTRNVDRVISLNLLERCPRCSVIDFPDDFWWFRSHDSRVPVVREQIGAVGGELRLLQVVVLLTSIVNLKVWKLDVSSWVLVHDKKYSTTNKEEFVAPFVHPTNGDVVFMVWGKNVFQYNLLMEDTYEMIDELREPLKLGTNVNASDGLMSFPMVHPFWPTQLPTFLV